MDNIIRLHKERTTHHNKNTEFQIGTLINIIDTTNKQQDVYADGENSVVRATDQNALAAIKAVPNGGTAVVKFRIHVLNVRTDLH